MKPDLKLIQKTFIFEMLNTILFSEGGYFPNVRFCFIECILNAFCCFSLPFTSHFVSFKFFHFVSVNNSLLMQVSRKLKFLPKKSQMKMFLKSRGDLKPCRKTCSRAQTRPYSPHSSRVRLPLCGGHKGHEVGEDLENKACPFTLIQKSIHYDPMYCNIKPYILHEEVCLRLLKIQLGET